MSHDSHGKGGYERTDAAAGATLRAGLAILAIMFLTALLVLPMYRFLARSETAKQPPPAEVLKTEMSEPVQTFPRLVESEPRVLAEFRKGEDALLTSYGWVEKDKGVARIPIAEAMRIVAERGLPTFAPAPSPQASARLSASPSAAVEGGEQRVR